MHREWPEVVFLAPVLAPPVPRSGSSCLPRAASPTVLSVQRGETGDPPAGASRGSSGWPSAPAGGASLDPAGATRGPGSSRRRRTAVRPSAGRGRGSGGGGSVSSEPERGGPSRRSGAGQGRGAMWFMYVLSWLSLFIQVSFITLAVGESARPQSARAPSHLGTRARWESPRPGAGAIRRPLPGAPGLRIPTRGPPGLAPPADPSRSAGPRVLPGVAKPAPAARGVALECPAPARRLPPRPPSGPPAPNFSPVPPPFRLRPLELTLTLTGGPFWLVPAVFLS